MASKKTKVRAQKRKCGYGLWFAGLPLLGLGCNGLMPAAGSPAPLPPIVRASAEVTELPATKPELIPAPPTPSNPTGEKAEAPGLPPAAPRVLPISLDTVLALADEQNTQIALARERVREACAEKDVAAQRWLPDLYAGTAYYRHEGGIQNEVGTLLHSSTGAMFSGLELHSRLDIREIAYQRVSAERKAWQQKGELSRITNETLLDAAGTYIDLLTARTGEAIAREQERDLENLLERAKKLADTEPGARVEVARIQAELSGRRQTILKLHEQAFAASAKLVYLLGLDPCIELMPVDPSLVPISLVDASPPACDLVALALAAGPGIREMEGLLALVHDSIERAQGPGRLLPVFETRMAEGAFGAGPNDNLPWDNRWDLGLQARWNLTEFCTARDRRRVALAKMHQAHLLHRDLQGKLTAGVQEAREAILSGHEQIRLGEEQISNARKAHELSNDRLKNNIVGSSPSEVLLSLQAVGLAQVNYLNAIRSYDRAQLRLMLLLGTPTGHPHATVHPGPPAPACQLPISTVKGQ